MDSTGVRRKEEEEEETSVALHFSHPGASEVWGNGCAEHIPDCTAAVCPLDAGRAEARLATSHVVMARLGPRTRARVADQSRVQQSSSRCLRHSSCTRRSRLDLPHSTSNAPSAASA